VVSIDAKKKELVGTFKNGCREYAPGVPERVKVHDLPDKELGKAIADRAPMARRAPKG
jgi:Rhodopirellula transposase DDE domain